MITHRHIFWRLTIVPLPLFISEDVQAADLYILPSFGSGGPVKVRFPGARMSGVKATLMSGTFSIMGKLFTIKRTINNTYIYIYTYTIWAYNVYIAMTYPAVWVEEHPSIPSFFATNSYIIVKRCNILLPLWLRCLVGIFRTHRPQESVHVLLWKKTHINRLGGVIA